MALNYSHRPIFPAHLPDENIGQGGSHEKDIVDILPADPFGMDISSTVTAITGWLEDLGVSDYGGCRRGVDDGVGVGKGHYSIFGGFNFWWDTPMGVKRTDSTLFRDDRFDGFVTGDVLERFVDNGVRGYGCFSTKEVVFGCGDAYDHGNKNVSSHNNVNDTMFLADGFNEFLMDEASSHDEMFGCIDTTVDENKNGEEIGGVIDETDDECPHPALSFALAYLGIRDLLSVEKVCKSLRFTIQNDPLLWKTIQFEHPLNDRVTDDVLLQLTSRAQGHLQCLCLVECPLVTDDGLRRVLESNPRLNKLSVSGCIKISTVGVMNYLKAFQSNAVTGIKCLRVAGRPVTVEQFEELMSLLAVHSHKQPNHRKPHFFNRENLYLSFEDERLIDLEICPKCKMAKLVYDCTAQSCQASDQTAQLCRACIHCVRRCDRCGRCIDGVKYVETFDLGYLCLDCSPEMSKCQGGQDIESRSSEHIASCDLDG